MTLSDKGSGTQLFTSPPEILIERKSLYDEL
jgi:hypothetical protein